MLIPVYYIPIVSTAILELKMVLILLFVVEVVPSIVTEVKYEFPIIVFVDTYCKSCIFYWFVVVELGEHIPGLVANAEYVIVPELQAVHWLGSFDDGLLHDPAWHDEWHIV